MISEGKSSYYPVEMQSGGNVSVMPPAHLVNAYQITNRKAEFGVIKSKGYEVNGEITKLAITVDYNKEMRKYIRDKWKEEGDVYRDYIRWPARLTLYNHAARENDRKLKVYKFREYKEELDKFDWGQRPLDLCYKWIEDAKKHLGLTPWTMKYIMHHAGSHPTSAITWEEIVMKDMLKQLYNHTDKTVDVWETKFYDEGQFCLEQACINFGSRGRSPDARLMKYILTVLERGRQIGFVEGPSSINAFYDHVHNIKLMRGIFDEYEQELGTKIISPKLEGSIIYPTLRDLNLDGQKLEMYDVAGMELITPSILNGATTNMCLGIGMVVGYLEDIPELLSGVACTSDWDMIAHLELLTKLITKTPDLIVILGDDCTLVNGAVKPSVLYELQELDTRCKRVLGLTVGDRVHPIGENITIDKARADHIDDGNWIKNKLTTEERWNICEMFTGFINGEPISDILRRDIVPEFIYSPKDYLREIFKTREY